MNQDMTLSREVTRQDMTPSREVTQKRVERRPVPINWRNWNKNRTQTSSMREQKNCSRTVKGDWDDIAQLLMQASKENCGLQERKN